MIEAMACGTPVLAFRCGSVPEVMEDNVTGLIVDTPEQAIAALRQVMALDRRKVRWRFEQRFTATHMAHDYLRVYHSLLSNSCRKNSTSWDPRPEIEERPSEAVCRLNRDDNRFATGECMDRQKQTDPSGTR
ncbi:MAG: hypothetical protein QOD94_3121 [Alphaproteobacteria bacterium]|nr:hypothetical protein [Alphaproteobacteria bacterium]